VFNKIPHTNVKRVSRLTSAEFVNDFKNTATPVVMSKLTEQWPAVDKWNLDYLSSVAGDNIVPVYSSKPAKDNEHQHAAAQHLVLRDYLNLLKQGENDLRMFFYNILNEVPDLLNDFTYPEIGLKFFKRLPVLFVGGRGTKVQMHYDIDLADLILCHFGGTKHVLLIPPEQTQYIYKVPYSFSALHSIDLSRPDYQTYPALKELKPTDCLYIPSGFWHYIIYEDIGFSMTLRAMPTRIGQRLTLLKNVFYTRTIEGIMRKLIGQKWNDRNERLAIEKTHKKLKF